MGKKNLAMPYTVAGIVGMSPDEELEGIKIRPEHFLIFTILLLIVAKLVNFVWNTQFYP